MVFDVKDRRLGFNGDREAKWRGMRRGHWEPRGSKGAPRPGEKSRNE